MESHRIASHDEWIEARKQLLAKEKEFTRLRDQLSQQRRELPWERVEKPCVFDGPNGRETLSDLFEGRQQLIVYHFMFDTGWDAGCKSCSFWADNFNGIVVHLKHRDVTLIAVSRAPLAKLEAYKKRMGWTFKWVSSAGCDLQKEASQIEKEKESEESCRRNYCPSSSQCLPKFEPYLCSSH